MASSPLLLQIKDRTTAFLKNTGISQAQLCRYLAIDHSSLSQFLSGTKGLDPSVVIKLCQTLSLSHREVAAKFTEPVRSSKILNLQESVAGQPAQMRMDDSGGSWIPGLIGSGTDPNDAIGNNTIVDPPDGPTEADLNCLRRVRKIHRQVIRLINSFINTAKQARVNRGDGTTEPTGQKFSANNTLKTLHTKMATRILTPEDTEYFLTKDLAKLKELSSDLDDSERAADIAEKRKELKDQTAELETRRIKLRKKYAK